MRSLDEPAVLFIVPRSGSLAFARLQPPAGDAAGELTVTVPDGTAALEVQTRTESGEPIGGVGIVIRYNGTRIPPQVIEGLYHYQGSYWNSDADGRLYYPHLPPGQYELWPLGSREDYLTAFAPAPPPPAVVLPLQAGEQTIVMKFREKPAG